MEREQSHKYLEKFRRDMPNSIGRLAVPNRESPAKPNAKTSPLICHQESESLGDVVAAGTTAK